MKRTRQGIRFHLSEYILTIPKAVTVNVTGTRKRNRAIEQRRVLYYDCVRVLFYYTHPNVRRNPHTGSADKQQHGKEDESESQAELLDDRARAEEREQKRYGVRSLYVQINERNEKEREGKNMKVKKKK
jgi:hypothetical protein